MRATAILTDMIELSVTMDEIEAQELLTTLHGNTGAMPNTTAHIRDVLTLAIEEALATPADSSEPRKA